MASSIASVATNDLTEEISTEQNHSCLPPDERSTAPSSAGSLTVSLRPAPWALPVLSTMPADVESFYSALWQCICYAWAKQDAFLQPQPPTPRLAQASTHAGRLNRGTSAAGDSFPSTVRGRPAPQVANRNTSQAQGGGTPYSSSIQATSVSVTEGTTSDDN